MVLYVNFKFVIVEVEVELGFFIYGDVIKLKQVVINFMKNSIEVVFYGNGLIYILVKRNG